MTSSAVQKTVRVLIGVGAILLFAIGAAAFLSYKLAEVGRWTFHSHQVIEQLKDSLAALQDVETGERGYVLTQQKRFLEPYNWGKPAATEHLSKVAKLIEDNPEQQRNLAVTNELARQKVQFADETVAEDNTKARAAISTGQEKKIMDAFRMQVAVMVESESNLLARRTRELHQMQAAVMAATAVLGVSGLALLFWVAKITRTSIEELSALNMGLQSEIEQRRRTEKTLKETTVRSASSNTDLQQFAYVASHDLQEPLRAVSGFLTLIASKYKGNVDAETEGWINHAVEGAHRMRRLINDLLSYARVDSRGKALEKTDCNKALGLAKNDLSVIINETGAQLHSGSLPVVLGDESQLTQLFQNLIGNALKFRGPAPPVVTIEANRQGDQWLFAINDNGIGFDQEHAERIFVIFQRLQGREEYKGTGIGLALCKKIVERHGGRIWAQSAKGEGSSFYFTIPVVQGES